MNLEEFSEVKLNEDSKILRKESNLNLIVDGLSSDLAFLFDRNKDNYKELISDIKIEHKYTSTLIKAFKSFFNNPEHTEFQEYLIKSEKTHYFKFISEDYYILIQSFTSSKETIINLFYNNNPKEVIDIINKYSTDEDIVKISVANYYITGQGSLEINYKYLYMKDFQSIKEYYYPFLNIQELCKQYFLSDSNILLLSGIPGNGKTKSGSFMMKFLLEEFKKYTEDEKYSNPFFKNTYDGVKIAYIKNEEILARDDFWLDLQQENYHMVLLDDLDNALSHRTVNSTSNEESIKNKFLSNLLSYTDGIYNSDNCTKFFITTNREIDNLDSAALRKGRTFDILEYRELTNAEALYIWKKEQLEEKLFYEYFKTEKVLQADLGSTISDIIKSREEGISTKPYCLEEGISILDKRKISLKKPLGL